MSNEQPSRPPKRSGSGASPMGSTLAIVIAIAAVVVGFLILKNIRSDDDGDATGSTTTPVATTIDPSLTTTHRRRCRPSRKSPCSLRTTQGAKVQVANSSHANGVAGMLTTALQGKGFTMGEPTNGATKEAVTKIQYLSGDTAAQAVAQSVAQLMGVADGRVIPTPVQLQDPSLLADNTVLVLLGDDKAGKTLGSDDATRHRHDAGRRNDYVGCAVSRCSIVAAARSMHHKRLVHRLLAAVLLDQADVVDARRRPPVPRRRRSHRPACPLRRPCPARRRRPCLRSSARRGSPRR